MNGFKLNVVNCLVAISLVIVSLVVPVVAANLVQMPRQIRSNPCSRGVLPMKLSLEALLIIGCAGKGQLGCCWPIE